MKKESLGVKEKSVSEVLKNSYPSSNLLTFKPIVTEGRMVCAKRVFPSCNLQSFRSLSY